MASEENLERAVERLTENSRETQQRLRMEMVGLDYQIRELTHKVDMLSQQQKDNFDLAQIRMGSQFKLLRWMTFVSFFLTFLLFMELVLFRGK